MKTLKFNELNEDIIVHITDEKYYDIASAIEKDSSLSEFYDGEIFVDIDENFDIQIIYSIYREYAEVIGTIDQYKNQELINELTSINLVIKEVYVYNIDGDEKNNDFDEDKLIWIFESEYGIL